MFKLSIGAAGAGEYERVRLPQEVIDKIPWNTVIKITERHSTAESTFREPAQGLTDPGDQKVALRIYYANNIFEVENEKVTWEFLDKLGVERTHMLKCYRIRADRAYDNCTWLGESGLVFEIGWNCLNRPKHLARWHLHRDAVWIKLRDRDEPATWRKLTEIEGLRVEGGNYDWNVRPAQEPEFKDHSIEEQYLWTAQKNRSKSGVVMSNPS